MDLSEPADGNYSSGNLISTRFCSISSMFAVCFQIFLVTFSTKYIYITH
uniref:Uncharacterized protein n=1 Tax=Heterorhabditis bacteriophora TaxID=37862 RepID=A0A1I7WEA9_HETBA